MLPAGTGPAAGSASLLADAPSAGREEGLQGRRRLPVAGQEGGATRRERPGRRQEPARPSSSATASNAAGYAGSSAAPAGVAEAAAGCDRRSSHDPRGRPRGHVGGLNPSIR
ncbi:hypothetical protein ACR6C2_29050 [Streptomyces sp. INA 01156]